MIRVPQGVFSVMVSDRPYISNPIRFARDSIRDKRLRTAVEKHRSWISVDLMDDEIESSSEAYGVIGKVLGAMGWAGLSRDLLSGDSTVQRIRTLSDRDLDGR